MDLKELELIGPDQERHWYYASKSRALLRALGDYQPRRILDVGAGSGFFRACSSATPRQSARCASTLVMPKSVRSSASKSGSSFVAPSPRQTPTSCC